jgi:hypothetical protein
MPCVLGTAQGKVVSFHKGVTNQGDLGRYEEHYEGVLPVQDRSNEGASLKIYKTMESGIPEAFYLGQFVSRATNLMEVCDPKL